jgi:ABC-type lipoprotein export system ATPase subunit
MSDDGVVIRLSRVRMEFDGGGVVALDDVDLEVHAGEFVAIRGPSGSGKTTLLNVMGAMDVPTGGTVEIGGEVVHDPRTLDRIRAENVGFVFQRHNLIPVLTATQNVEVPMIPRKEISATARRARARELLEHVGLGHRLDSDVRVLSGGERQRIAIARAMANEPPILLADEPTGNLDTTNGRIVMDTLHEMRRRTNAALIVVTHDDRVCEGADRTYRMIDGRLHPDADER